MNFVSVCSGIEAASVAWGPLGWNALAFSEIDRFPSLVLKHRYPEVPNLGDMTKHALWPKYNPDLVAGGTPCQAFSLAGFREGLNDPRGNLTLTFLSVVDQYSPRWVVWENVPGVLSDRTNAFGQFLAGLGKLGYGWAYRVLDAQYFGVPQRRRRVVVVGCLGGWASAAAVLFEPESLRGNPPPSRQKGQTTAGALAASTGGSDENDAADGRLVVCRGVPEIARTIHTNEGTNLDYETSTIFPVAHNARSGDSKDEYIVPVGFHHNAQVDQMRFENNLSGTLTGSQQAAVMYKGVRRLTPRECERLQGFLDDYTAIFGDKTPDGPRYKALGNSWAVPKFRWLGERISRVDTLV